ncbi:unnamed protein product [Rodentolepis nana]|uniref:Glutaredoxin domain-containing protein n=1 Tax=Rodentolepis nana TaxID=102285 RepID=A0A0R3TKE7_RODNA|nr:unnamed protein product [Rodentolepis nana]
MEVVSKSEYFYWIYGMTHLVSPASLYPRYFSDAPKLDKALHDRLTKLTTQSRVVILMKGNPQEPQCGFSNAVCRILEAHGVLDKKDPKTGSPIASSFNILSDDSIRNGAKIFSDWPTFPQVYIDGEFIGGCDILLDMHRSGKLAEELEKWGIGSTLKGEDTMK